MRQLLFCLILALVLSADCSAAPITIRILHLNDFHGFANPSKAPGGALALGDAARLAAEIHQQRTPYPSLLLVAGDAIHGDTWARLSQGKSVIELLNLLGVDAMSLGNHEFDYGQAVLKQRISEARFPVLAANLSDFPGILPRMDVTRNGLRISIIGLVTEETPYSSHPRNMAGLRFRPVIETARLQLGQAQQNADLIVLLTHQGYEHDRALAQNLCGGPVATATIPVLIVGGHTHTRLEQPTRIGNCIVVQAWEHGKTLGLVDLTIDNGRLLKLEGRLIEITPAIDNGDPAVAALVHSYNQEAAELLDRKAGTAEVDLIQQGSRLHETNLGNLVADIVRQATGAEAAIINGGSLRFGIPKGSVTVRQIQQALPFNNYLVAVRMSGSQLLSALEHGVSGVEHEEGRFPQVSGINFSFNPARPVGQRVVSAAIGGKPLRVDQEYTVATLDFIAAGGDGYTSFGEAIRSSGDFSEVSGAMQSSRLVYNDPGRFLRDMVLETLETGQSVSPVLEGRIRELR